MSGGLKLSRKAGETIRVGSDVEIHIEHVGGGRVELIITAPRDVMIVRSELEEGPDGAPTPKLIMHRPHDDAGVRRQTPKLARAKQVAERA